MQRIECTVPPILKLPAPPTNPLPLKASHPNGLPAGQATLKRYFSGQQKAGKSR